MTLGCYQQSDIVEAFELFVIAGKEFPPTLPEFRKACDDLQRQHSMRNSTANQIKGRSSPEIAEYYKMCIKRILKVKDGDMEFPWMAKVEDATDEQLNLIRVDLGNRGIQVHHFSEYAA